MSAAMNSNHRNRALAAIRDDHRALAAVLHGMRYLVRDIRDHGKPPRFDVLRAMLHYIDAFPERHHHPKESRYLFARIRARTNEADAMLADLETEHALGGEMIRHLEQGLLRYEEGGAEYFSMFATAVEAYGDFHYQHMRKEEDLILPIAERALTEADWAELDTAFTRDPDPLQGAGGQEDFDKLFKRIVALAPPPIGVGPD
jgi:hemerythrin-like domain-containing protein